MEEVKRKSVELVLGDAVVFNSPTMLAEWIDAERESWGWLNDVAQGQYTRLVLVIKRAVIDWVLDMLDEIESKWREGAADFSSEAEQLNLLLKEVNFPFSNTALGRHIQLVSNESQLTAAFMLFLAAVPTDRLFETAHGGEYVTQYDNVIPSNTRSEQFISWFKSEAYRNEANRRLLMFMGEHSSGDALAYRDSMDGYLDDIVKTKNKATDVLMEFEKWQELVKFQTGEWLSAAQSRYTSFGRKIFRKVIRRARVVNNAVRDSATSAQTELLDSKEAFVSQVEFAESVGYWNDKERTHAASKRGWFIALCCALLVTLIVPFVIFLLPNDFFGEAALVFGAYHPGKVLLTALAVSVGSYAVRFSSKQYSSQQHLYLEAVERQTMLKTYIGLMLNGKLSEQEDRKAALDTIFRPAQTGVVVDHGAVMPSDTVVKVFDKHSKP